MFIYIDESGTFVPTEVVGSWCVVAAYVVPESDRRHVEEVLRRFKVSNGRRHSEELKLRDVREEAFANLLAQLGRLESRLIFSAIDLGTQDALAIAGHQASQVERIQINRDRMLYDEGKSMIDDLSSRVKQLSPQLYIQFVVQIALLDEVFRTTTMYYSQRIPATLGAFRWVVDQKNALSPRFEEILRYLAPGFLQSGSLWKPAVFVEGFDYRHFDRSFRCSVDEIPKHLQEHAGVEVRSAANLTKVFSDLSFVDSKDVSGVQLADLLASGLRRALRGDFADSYRIMSLLGALMVQRPKSDSPLHLITLGSDSYSTGHVAQLAKIAAGAASRMIR